MPAGRYTVTLSLLSQPGTGFEDVAAARLQIRPEPPVSWETARFRPAAGAPAAEGYAVDSGMAAFSTPPSAAAVTRRLDRDSTYVYRDFQPKLVERLGEPLANQILRDNVIRAFRRGDKVT